MLKLQLLMRGGISRRLLTRYYSTANNVQEARHQVIFQEAEKQRRDYLARLESSKPLEE